MTPFTVQTVFPLLSKDIKWGSRVGSWLWNFLFPKITNIEGSAGAGPFPKKLTELYQCNRNNSSKISCSKNMPFWFRHPVCGWRCAMSVTGRFPWEGLDSSLWHSQRLQLCCYLGQIIRQHEWGGAGKGETFWTPIHITASKPQLHSTPIHLMFLERLLCARARELLDAANFQAFGLKKTVRTWKDAHTFPSLLYFLLVVCQPWS